MASSQLSLPQVMMRVDEARADDLAAAIDKLSASGCAEALTNFGNAVRLDQNIGLP